MGEKNREQKTSDDFLKRVLLPKEEKPYEIPDNWIWVRLDSYFKNINEQKDPDGTENYIGLEHLEKGGGIKEIATAKGIKSRKVIFQSGDVLYGKLRPYLNKHAVVNFDGIASTDILVYRSDNHFSNKLLDFYLGLPLVIKYSNENSNGINLPRVSPKVMNNMPFPLAPKDEQKRIIYKLESLLSNINEAKYLIKEAKETFEIRRAAILDKAFRGELTANWRDENKEVLHAFDFLRNFDDVRRKKLLPKEKPNYLKYIFEKCVSKIEELPNSWVQAPVGFLCDCIVPGRDKPKSFTGDIPWITIPDINQDYLNKSDASSYLSEEEIKEVKARVIPSNSVVMSCVGRFGVSAIVKTPLVINQQLHAFLPSVMINPKYLMYHIRTLVPYMNKKATSTTISYLNKTNANSLPINVPPIEEQREIVKILDNYFKKDTETLILIEQQLEQIEQIKTSILSKAFRGELGTNDPNEESALELLKEILSEKAGR